MEALCGGASADSNVSQGVHVAALVIETDHFVAESHMRLPTVQSDSSVLIGGEADCLFKEPPQTGGSCTTSDPPSDEFSCQSVTQRSARELHMCGMSLEKVGEALVAPYRISRVNHNVIVAATLGGW